MPRIERKKLLHIIDTKFGKTESTPTWEKLGKHLEDFSVALNPDTESFKNILGEEQFVHRGYLASSDADPYYADSDDGIYEALQAIVDGRQTGDELYTRVVEVHLWEESTSSSTTYFRAYKQGAYIVPSSYGGDTGGYQIPFSINYVGERTEGAVTITAGVCAWVNGTWNGGTFTPAT